MGFLDRLLSRKQQGGFSKGSSINALVLPGANLVSVVGESYYQPAINLTAQNATKGNPPLPISVGLGDEDELPWFQALIVREPDNPYDENAIMVWSPYGQLGHLCREDALDYQDVLLDIEARGRQAGACSGFLRRASNGMWGVVLVLSSPDDCLADLASE